MPVNIPSFRDLTMNSVWDIPTAKQYMEDYINGDKADLPTFIRTDWTGTRLLENYDDSEFDNINQKAFTLIKNIKLTDFYNKTNSEKLADNIVEQLTGENNRSLTIEDVLKSRAENFYTTLDLSDDNVLQALGEYGYLQYRNTGTLLGPIKALLTERNPEGRKDFDFKTALRGFRDANIEYFKNMAEGTIVEGNYLRGMSNLMEDIELTNSEYMSYGREIARMVNDKFNIELKPKKDAEGNVYYDLPKPSSKYTIPVVNMNEQQKYDLLNEIGSFDVAKWKRLMKKYLTSMFKLEGDNPNIAGATKIPYGKDDKGEQKDAELKDILASAQEYEQELKTYMEGLNPDTSLFSERRGTGTGFMVGLRDKKVEEELDEDGNPKPLGDTPSGQYRLFDVSMLNKKETMNSDDLIDELTDLVKINKFKNFNHKVNASNIVYTISTDKQDWKPYLRFLKIGENDRGVNKINRTGNSTFESSMDIPFGGETVELANEDNTLDILIGSLEDDGELKFIENFIETIQQILEKQEDIKRYYTSLSEDKKIEEGFGEAFDNLSEYLEENEREDIYSKLEDYKGENSTTLKAILRSIGGYIGDTINVFSNYIGELDSEEKQTDNPLLDENDNEQIKLLDEELNNFEIMFNKIKTYNKPEKLSIENIGNSIEQFINTEQGSSFKEIYESILNEEEFSKDKKPAVLARIKYHFNLHDNKNEGEIQEIFESFVEQLNSEQKSLLDIFLTTIVVDNKIDEEVTSDSRKWGQAAKWNTEGSIEFKLIISVGSTVKIKAEVFYYQDYDIKPVLNMGSGGGDFYNTAQKKFSQIDRKSKGRSYSITASGRDIAEVGIGVDTQRKDFIDKLEDRIQRLESVI